MPLIDKSNKHNKLKLNFPTSIDILRVLLYISNILEIKEMKQEMNKAELVKAMADETSLSQKDVEKVLNSFVNQVSTALENKDKVQLVGFGTFETRERAARTGRNPQTGEEIAIAATVAPAFKAGKALKDKVNK